MELMTARHLLSAELDYELRLRGVVSKRDHAEKRKILQRLLDKEKHRQAYSALSLVDPQYDNDIEIVEIPNTLSNIESLIADVESTRDSLYSRLCSRIQHITNRVSRYKIDENNEEESTTFKNEAYATCLSLEAQLDEKVSVNGAAVSLAPVAQHIPPPQPVIVHVPSAKSIPIYKWGVTFSGESTSMSVHQFLERIEELRVARNTDKAELFTSAVDLFTGKALLWYRSVRNKVNNWDELVNIFRNEYLPSDYEDQLWDDLKDRYQGKSENITAFVAVMETIFSRLSRPPAEATKVKIIRKNLLPMYLTQLEITQVDTVVNLVAICKKIEDLSLLKQKPRISQRNSCVLEPELACTSVSAFIPKVAEDVPKKSAIAKLSQPSAKLPRSVAQNPVTNRSVASQSSAENLSKKHNDSPCPENKTLTSNNYNNRSKVVCWNCKQPNHFYPSCTAERNKFCYRCGTANYVTTTCPKCNNKTGNE